MPIEDLKVNFKGVMDASNLDIKAIDSSSKLIMAQYKVAEAEGKRLTSMLEGFTNLDDAYESNDPAMAIAFKSLTMQLDKAGIADMGAYNSLRKANVPSRESLKQKSAEELLSYFSEFKQQQIADGKDVSISNLKIKKVQAEEMLAKSFSFQKEQLNVSADASKAKAGRSLEYNKENLEINFQNQIAKIQRQGQQQAAAAVRNYQNNLAIMAIQYRNSMAKLGRQKADALEDIETSRERGTRDIATSETRGKRDIATSKVRGERDIRISEDRGMEKIALSQLRGLIEIDLNRVRGIEDLNLKYARTIADLSKKKGESVTDLGLKRDRSIEDVLRNFVNTVDKLNRNFADNIAAIERSRQDTIDAFQRNLERPQVVNLNVDSLVTIADNLGDVSLALDAHKAALTANTTAVQQNNKLQQTQEDIAKDAYKDAYKKVGGEVYNADGTVNESFITAYNDYMAKNSEALIDAVLENALDAAYSGVGFDITSALQSPEYLAGQVAAPSPGMTMPGALAGTGMTVDELIDALYNVKSDEVRVTTTAGVILEAQGGMEGALFDLETAFIGIDIKLREAGIALEISLREASISLELALVDIEIAYERGLQDLDIAFGIQLENISIMLTQGMQDITISTNRAVEDLNTSVKNAIVDLAISVANAGEDLRIKIADAGEDLKIKISDAMADLTTKLADAAEDVVTNFSRAAREAGIAYAEQVEIAGIKLAMTLEEIGIKTAEAMAEAEIGYEDALDGLERNYEKQLLEIDESIAVSLAKLTAGFDNSMDVLVLQYNQGLTSLTDQHNEAIIKMFQLAADWASKTHDAIALGFESRVWDASKVVERLQRQLDTAMKTFTLKADVIVKAVAVSFKTALESPRFKSLLATYAETNIGEALVKGLTDSKEPILKVVEGINKGLVDSFKLELGIPMEDLEKNLKRDVASIGDSSVAYTKVISTAATTSTASVEVLNKAAIDLKGVATATATAGKEIKTKSAIAKAEVELAGNVVGAGLEAVGTKASDAADLTKLKINTSGTKLGTSIKSLGDKVAEAARRAVIAINQAIIAAQNAVPRNSSMGGIVGPGYGGGDILPYMLEPGEFVVRKEVVRAFGENKLEDINNSVGGSFESMMPQKTSLPMSLGSSINISMNVQAGTGIEVLEQNMERIADGVKKVFEEYS